MNDRNNEHERNDIAHVFRSSWKPGKEEVVTKNGMVTAMQPLSAEAGLEVLKKGGNAIDSAVAMIFCNVVIEPYMANIGGMGYMLVYLAKEGKTVSIDFTCRAPRNARPDMYRVLDPDGSQKQEVGPQTGGFTSLYFSVEDDANIQGALSVTVPTLCAGICEAHRRYGTLTLEELLEPAIHFASEGFESNWQLTLYAANLFNAFSEDPYLASMWLPDGHPPRSYPKPGERIIQRDLGELLKRIARHGPDAMYRGDVADEIEKFMQKNGGILTSEDLQDYSPGISDPLSVPFKQYNIMTVPTPSGGVTNLQMFRVLESFDLYTMGHNSVEYLNLIIQSGRQTFADRHRYLGDWDYTPVPLKGLLSADYARELAKQVDLKGAGVGLGLDKEPWIYYMDRALHDPWKFDASPAPDPIYQPAIDTYKGDTAHINVVDKDRNVVTCTHTGPFIAGANPPSTGVYLSGGMSLFIAKPGFANSIDGWKRSISSMSPLMVLQNGRPILCQGAPGARRIINRSIQVVNNVIVFGMGPQEAIIQPTIDASTKQTLVDSRVPSETIDKLRRLGHEITVVEEEPGMLGNFSRPSAIYIDHESGLLSAGVDAFRPAMALGY